MALYSNMAIWLDGLLLFNNTTIDTELTSDDQEVMTIPGGFVGMTPSPSVRRITAANVSPIAGEDYDFEAAKENRLEVEVKMQQIGADKQCMTKGYITSVSRSVGVGQTATISFVFVGTPSVFA
jgi:hypothetical protein